MSDSSENKVNSNVRDLKSLMEEKKFKLPTETPYLIDRGKFNFPHISEKGKPLDCEENLKLLLDYFKIEVKYNLMNRSRYIHIPSINFLNEEYANASLLAIREIATINFLPTKTLDKLLDSIAWKNPFHPIVDSIKTNPWDEISRIDDFINTLETDNPELSYKIIKTWLVCAIAAAYSDTGFTNHGVLVLQGKQSLGKTAWIKRLDPIDCNAVKIGAFLDPGSKDSIAQLAQYWIAELGEIDSIFSKSAIGRLKSFITMDFDYVRLPYAIRASRLSRRTVYAATVNDDKYLVDDTGNRRWWTIAVKKVNYEHKIDMQQLWAEVYVLWQQGALTYLPRELEEELNQSNKQYEKIDPIYEQIISSYDWEDTFRRKLTATQILQEIGYKNPKKDELNRCSKILQEINGIIPKRTKKARLHLIPKQILQPMNIFMGDHDDQD